MRLRRRRDAALGVDDEVQPQSAGTAAEGSSGDPTMAQEEEGGQPKEEEEPTDILDRLRREDRVSLTPEQMLGRQTRVRRACRAAAASAAANAAIFASSTGCTAMASPTAAAAAEGESILDRLRCEQSPELAWSSSTAVAPKSRSSTAMTSSTSPTRRRASPSSTGAARAPPHPLRRDRVRDGVGQGVGVGRKVIAGRHSGPGSSIA